MVNKSGGGQTKLSEGYHGTEGYDSKMNEIF
jgi:hypothetical protein